MLKDYIASSSTLTLVFFQPGFIALLQYFANISPAENHVFKPGIDKDDGYLIEIGGLGNIITKVPLVHRIEYTIIKISADGLLTLVTEKGAPMVGPDLTLSPADLVTRTRTKHLAGKKMVVEVEFAMGKEKIVAVKEIIKPKSNQTLASKLHS